MYNGVYRVALAGWDRPVILRVAPEEARQFRSERHLMRNEYASLPWLAAIAPLMRRVLAADWSHEVISRDWMFQSHLDGAPAPEHLGTYPRTAWPTFFRQMGAIARRVHHVPGTHFGPVSGPAYGTWGEAVIASLEEIAADLDRRSTATFHPAPAAHVTYFVCGEGGSPKWIPRRVPVRTTSTFSGPRASVSRSVGRCR